MIYDLIQLPMRHVTGELSSIIPRFTRFMQVDDVDWYGRSINLDSIRNNLFKYKSIEPMGTTTIERIFMSPEPIDFKKRWDTADIDMYPIMFKVFKYPYTAECDVYRYLNGTHNVLGTIDSYTHMQTLSNKLYRTIFPYGCEDAIPKQTKDLIPHVINGNDNTNLETFTTMSEFVSNNETPFWMIDSPLSMNDVFPKYPKDCTQDLFIKDMKVSSMKPIMTPQCFNGIFRKTMSYVPTPFDVDSKTVFNDDFEYSKWTLHELIQALERSVYTDIHIKIDYKDRHDIQAKVDTLSRYIGLSTADVPGTKESTEQITELLRKWAGMTSGCTPKTVELWKNWAEEIFITIDSEKGICNYYFDIPTYSLTNLSFVDIIG